MEQQKEYQRLEDERFELIRFGCSWRHTPGIKGISLCMATADPCEKSNDCAIWQMLKGLGLI